MVMISIVIPVYQCASCLTELYKRLSNTLPQLTEKFEIILVDDRAKDNSWDVITSLAKQDSRVKGVRLSRNFGQQLAIIAGLTESKGDWVVVMDCDLQDPPEEIVNLYQKAIKGFDIVFAKRKQKQHHLFRKWLSKIYFHLMGVVSKDVFNSELGAFSIISRKVVDAFLKLKEKDCHYTFVLYWLGFNTGYIDYNHSERYCGNSSYSVRKLIKLALSGVLFQTTTLLRWIVYLGFSVSFLGLLSILYLFYRYYAYSVYPGWTSIVVLILIVGGMIISSLGVVALYIGGIFEQVKGRPLFVIDEKI